MSFLRRILPILTLAIAATALAADPKPPTTAPAAPAAPAAPPAPADQEAVVSKTRLQEIKGCTYLYSSGEATLNGVGQTIHTLIEPMTAAIEEGKIHPVGPPVFVYHGVTGERDKPFTLEVGFPIREEAKPPADFKVRKLDDLRCCGALFSGPMQQMAQAYQQIMGDVFTLGVEPSDEIREMILYWDNEQSPNNVVMVMVGIK